MLGFSNWASFVLLHSNIFLFGRYWFPERSKPMRRSNIRHGLIIFHFDTPWHYHHFDWIKLMFFISFKTPNNTITHSVLVVKTNFFHWLSISVYESFSPVFQCSFLHMQVGSRKSEKWIMCSRKKKELLLILSPTLVQIKHIIHSTFQLFHLNFSPILSDILILWSYHLKLFEIPIPHFINVYLDFGLCYPWIVSELAGFTNA